VVFLFGICRGLLFWLVRLCSLSHGVIHGCGVVVHNFTGHYIGESEVEFTVIKFSNWVGRDDVPSHCGSHKANVCVVGYQEET